MKDTKSYSAFIEWLKTDLQNNGSLGPVAYPVFANWDNVDFDLQQGKYLRYLREEKGIWIWILPKDQDQDQEYSFSFASIDCIFNTDYNEGLFEAIEKAMNI